MVKKKTVLITGGSGFLGTNLVNYLYKKGYKLKVIDLVMPLNYNDMKYKAKYVWSDIRKIKNLNRIFTGVDYIVHAAAALPLYSARDIYSTEIMGTENILRVAHRQKIKKFIYISSTAVYGIPDSTPLYEHHKLKGVGSYGKAKIKAEKICDKYRKKGMCVTILRPKTFMGPGRLGIMAIYSDWIRRGKNIPLIGNGNNHYQLLDVEDLCVAIELCLKKAEDKVNDTFNIGAKEFLTMREDFGYVVYHAGFKKKIIPLPKFPVISLLKILDFLKLSPLYQWIYETAVKDSVVSIEKAEKILGFKPMYSNKDTLLRTYIWYVKNLDKFENKYGVTHSTLWRQGVLKIVSWFF